MKHYIEKIFKPIKEMYCDWADGFKRIKVKYTPEKGYSVQGWFLTKEQKKKILETIKLSYASDFKVEIKDNEETRRTKLQ